MVGGVAVRLFELKESVVGRTSVVVVFSVTDNGGITPVDEVVGYVFACDGDGGGVTGLEAFRRGLGVVNLDMHLS